MPSRFRAGCFTQTKEELQMRGDYTAVERMRRYRARLSFQRATRRALSRGWSYEQLNSLLREMVRIAGSPPADVTRSRYGGQIGSAKTFS